MARTVTRRLRVKIDAQEQMSVTLQKIERNTKKFSDSFSKSIGFAAIKFQALTATARQFAAVADKIVRDAQIVKAFDRQNLSIDKARKATGGLVDDMTLMLARNREVALGLKLTDEEFAKMAKGAVIAGQAMGQDAAKSIEDITVGLGRMSKPILDNLGITLDLAKAYDTWAEANGRTVASMSDVEKRAAGTAQVMEQLDEKTKGASTTGSDFASNWSRITTQIANMQTEFTKWAAASQPLAEVLDNIVISFRAVRDVVDEITSSRAFQRFSDVFITGGTAAGTRKTRGVASRAIPTGGGGAVPPTGVVGGVQGRRRVGRGGGRSATFTMGPMTTTVPELGGISSDQASIIERGFGTVRGVEEQFGLGGGTAFTTGSQGDEGADMVAQFRAIQSEGERMTAAVTSSFINMASTAAAAAASGEASLGTLMQGIAQMLAQLAASAIGGPLGGLAAAGISFVGGLANRPSSSDRARSGRESALNQRRSARRGTSPRSSFT